MRQESRERCRSGRLTGSVPSTFVFGTLRPATGRRGVGRLRWCVANPVLRSGPEIADMIRP